MILFKKNSALLLERFPKLFPLFYEKVPEKPRKIQEDLETWKRTYDWKKAEVLYLYGLGAGGSYFALEEWLSEGKKDLIYLEDDLSSLFTFLHTPHAEKILQDPRVHIAFFHPKGKEAVLQELAHAFPVKRIEVIPAPHRMGKKEAFFSSLRLQLLRKTVLSEGLFIDRLHSYIPFANTLQNLFHLPHSFHVNKWKGAFKNVPAILCGAGPSLKKEIPFLKECRDRALVIAGGSAIAALTSHHVLPHLGVMVDPNIEEYHRLKASVGFEIPMIYHLRTKAEVFSTCNGPMGYMRSAIASLACLWLEEELGIEGPLLGDKLSDESLSVTSLALSLALFLGCNPIVFCGVDLSYAQGKRYAEGVVSHDANVKGSDEEKIAEDRAVQKWQQGACIDTNVRWVMESAVLSDFAKKHRKRRFFNASLGGLEIPSVPFRSLSEIITEFQTPGDLQGRIFAQIEKTKDLRLTREKVEKALQTLYESVERALSCVEILVSKKGSSVLAEMELQEEISFKILFYDTLDVLSTYVRREYPHASLEEKEHYKWLGFAAILQEYSRNLFRSVRR